MSLALASLGVVPLAVGSRVRVRRAAAARRTRTLNIGGSDPARVSFHGRVRATNRGRLDGRSPAARLGPLATSEDGPEREVATSDRSSPSDHMDDVPKVKFNIDDAGQPARSPAVRLASRLLAAVAFASAGLAVPFIAHAAKSASTPASAAVTASHGPNLIHMSDETRGKLDAVFLSGLHGARNVLKGLDAHINDPWDIEDIWLIIVWHYLIKNRRKVYEFSHTRLPGTPDADGSWESSFWRWTVHPMRVVGALWLSLYVFDNAVRVGTLLHMNRWLPDVVIAQFDRGMYTLAAGVMSVMATDHWLPRILEAKANIKDSSQRLVLTRLATVMLAITTVVCSAVVFGLPPRSLLGFGGVGGLAFGLAAKDLIGNFIGGSMLAVMRPFSPGEKIYLMTAGGRFRGTSDPSVGGYLVREIGWYQTTLVPKDTRPTTVPNGFFLGANVINISRQTARVIVLQIRVRLDDMEAIPAMTSKIESYLLKHEAIINPPKRPIRAHLRDVKDDHAAVRVECHSHVVKKDAFLVVNQDVVLGVWAIAKEHSSGPAWPVGCYDGASGRYKMIADID